MLPDGPKIEFKHPATLEWSVIVPVHARREPDTLRRCLGSVLPQLKEEMELVVVDHSSEQHGLFVLAAISGPAPPDKLRAASVKLVEPTGGMATDWNLALSHARGRWVHLLHDDDWVLPSFYEAAGRADADLHWVGYRNDRGGKTNLVVNDGPEPFWPNICCQNFLNPCAVAVRREVYERLGGYLPDPACYHGADWEFWIRAAQRGFRWGHDSRVLAVYGEEPGSMSHDTGCGWEAKAMAALLAAIRWMLAREPDPWFGDLMNVALEKYRNVAVGTATHDWNPALFEVACQYHKVLMERRER